MSTDPLRFGVIGAGAFASRRHLPDICRHAGARLVAICRRDREALERLREHFGAERVDTDWRTMLDECALDAVVIATPHNLHYEPARAALERGLHVLLEKPMTVRAEEARELRDLAAARGIQLQVALNPPFWRHCHWLRSAVQEGQLGELEAVHLTMTADARFVFGDAPRPEKVPGVVAPTPFRADPDLCGGGFLGDGGSHLVSELLWVTGRRILEVTCTADPLPGDRRAAMTLRLERDLLATVLVVGNSEYVGGPEEKGKRQHKLYAGSTGTMSVEGFQFHTMLRSGGTCQTHCAAELPQVPGPVENLIDAVHSRAPLLSPAEHGVQVVEAIEAAYESARTGQSVTPGQ